MNACVHLWVTRPTGVICQSCGVEYLRPVREPVWHQSPSYLCETGHPITAASARHGDHFLLGHSCTDGRFWAADPCSERVTVAADWRTATDALLVAA